MIAYFVEYRATFSLKMKHSGGIITTSKDYYGKNKGSVAYGKSKTRKERVAEDTNIVIFLRGLKKNPIAMTIYFLFNEICLFIFAMSQSPDHFRNILYFIISYFGS